MKKAKPIKPNNSLVKLFPPCDNVLVDLEKMIHYKENNTNKIYRVKTQNCNIDANDPNIKQKLSSIMLNLREQLQRINDKEFQFFWKEGEDHNDHNSQAQDCIWRIYDLENQLSLRAGYYDYLSNKQKEIDLHPPLESYYVNFEKLLQIHKQDKTKQRQITYCHPKLITKFVKTYRDLELMKNENSKECAHSKMNEDSTKTNIIQNIIVFSSEISKQIKNLFSHMKKPTKIFFHVFEEYNLELEIDEKLCLFENGLVITVPLEELKNILKTELKYIGTSDISFYIKEIDDIKSAENFFNSIIKMYTHQGFLYFYLNNQLRTNNREEISKIKYYFTCLYASFYFYSKTKVLPDLDKDQDLKVYRVSGFRDNELNQYEKSGSKNIIRVFPEFLSTSTDPAITRNRLDLVDKTKKQFFWEITIPKYFLRNETFNFANISSISVYQDESEILFKSGVVLSIDNIEPYYEVFEGKKFYFRNKYLKTCTLKSFSISSFEKMIIFDPYLKELNLRGAGIGVDENFMNYIKEALNYKSSITNLHLAYNRFGENYKSLEYFKKALIQNISIKVLNLGWNLFGKNELCAKALEQVLVENKSIDHLDLSFNSLGESEECALHIKNGLINNYSVAYLYLNWNLLGCRDASMKHISDGLLNHQCLKKLNLEGNNFYSNEQSAIYLKELLINNKSIQYLNLSNNGFGKKERIMIHLKEGLIENKSITNFYIVSNGFGENEKCMEHFRDALICSESIKNLSLESNGFGNNEDCVVLLKEALMCSSSLQNVCLAKNNLSIIRDIFLKDIRSLNELIEVEL